MTVLFHIPATPVDGYRIEWFRLSISGQWCYITPKAAVYHANTPYTFIDPSYTKGAPLVDDWMVYENGHQAARWVGWFAPLEHDWQDEFLTAVEAITTARDRLKQWIEEHRKDIIRLEAMIAALEPT